MEAWAWLAMIGGSVLVLVIVVDVFLTVLHMDVDGPVAGHLHRALWRLVILASRRYPGARRVLLGLAGPLMIASTFAVWTTTYVVGVALVYWPHLDRFRSAPGIGPLTFTDALYFSGKTATTVGFGDITPIAPALQMLALVQSVLGFALLTGIVTYLLSVVNGVAERNAVALRVHSETAQTGDGVEALIRSMSFEDLTDVHTRLESLVHSFQSMHQKMHQFPILDLFYRSHDPVHDPEPMLAAVAELAIAGQILSEGDGMRRLAPITVELGKAVTETMNLMALEYLSDDARRRIESPTADTPDHQYLERVRRRLQEALGVSLPETDRGGHDEILALAARTRWFLADLDHYSAWRQDHPAHQER